jgi:hypothetical protein
MWPVPLLHDPALRKVAEEVGDPPELVQHDLAEFFRLDLVDYGHGPGGQSSLPATRGDLLGQITGQPDAAPAVGGRGCLPRPAGV